MLFRLLYQFPAWLQRLYAGVTWRRDSAFPNQKTVYLTFDDGPIPEVTPKILAILEQKNVHATFFLVGDNVRKYPELLDRILSSGHRVGNHTFHHLPGLRTSLEGYLRDVSDCDTILSAHHNTGPHLFRPPYGRLSRSQKRELLNNGYEIILWDVLTHDYNRDYSLNKMLRIVQHYTRPGSIVVFHDSLKSNERMLAALPDAIDFWLRNGYTLSTL